MGILFGSRVLHVVKTDDLIDFLSQLGLAFLFFLAGSRSTTRSSAAGLCASPAVPGPSRSSSLVAITSIGTDQGLMRTETAAALVGAGMLSVFLYPFVAFELRRRNRPTPQERAGAEPVVDGEF